MMHLSILSRTNDICFPVFRFEPKGFTMPLTHKTYAFGLFPAHECPPVSEARTPTKKAGTQRKQLDGEIPVRYLVSRNLGWRYREHQQVSAPLSVLGFTIDEIYPSVPRSRVKDLMRACRSAARQVHLPTTSASHWVRHWLAHVRELFHGMMLACFGKIHLQQYSELPNQ